MVARTGEEAGYAVHRSQRSPTLAHLLRVLVPAVGEELPEYAFFLRMPIMVKLILERFQSERGCSG